MASQSLLVKTQSMGSRTCGLCPAKALHMIGSVRHCSPVLQARTFAAAPASQVPCGRPNRRNVCVRASVDPALKTGPYQPGKVMSIHGQPELESINKSDKLTVLMCKSSHCKPCQKFMSTYMELAARFTDCQLLEVVGDEGPNTRKMMMDMKVKVTPTFFLYRNGQQVATMTGTGKGLLRKAIMEKLKPHEAGQVGYDDVDGTSSTSDDE